MARKGKSTEEIIGFLREAEVRIAQGETAGKICRGAGISEQTYYKCVRVNADADTWCMGLCALCPAGHEHEELLYRFPASSYLDAPIAPRLMVAVREALMTVLNFLLTDEAVYLLTDTVLSDPEDLSPITFTTKVHTLPHLQAVICGTGYAQLIAEWVAVVNLSLPARDVVHLDRLAPAMLRGLFARHASEDATREITTTLYHFGFDERASRFVGFAYRSADDFRSEALPQGFGFKPAPEWDFDSRKMTRLPEHFIAIARKQKAQDEATDPAKRVVVGGQLIFCAMQRIPGPGKSTTVQTSLAICHTFPDFEEICARAAARPPGS